LLYAWNPLALFETAANGHNDPAMAFLVVLALYTFIGGRPRLSLVGLMAAALVKFIPLVLVPVLALAHLRAGKRWRTLVEGGLLSLALAVAAYVPFWVGSQTLGPLNRMGLFTNSLGALALHALEEGGVPYRATIAGVGAAALFLAYLVWRLWRLRPSTEGVLEGCFDVFFAYLVLGTIWFLPWYLILLLAVTATLGEGTRRWMAVAATAGAQGLYLVFGYIWHWFPAELTQVALQTMSVSFAFGPPLLVLLLSRLRK
jgi:hypothetical protein